MRRSIAMILAIVRKDLLSELRSKEIAVSILLFALLVIVVFSFAFDPETEALEIVAPGVLWIAFTFAGMLGLSRLFAAEKEKGGLEGLMLCPMERDLIYWGKLLGIFLFMMIVEAVITPIFLVLFDFPLWIPELGLISVLGTLGFAAVGTLFSAMAAHTKARDITLPVLFIPITVPVIIAAVKAAEAALGGEPFGEMASWLGIITAFDAIFLVVSGFVFEFVLEE